MREAAARQFGETETGAAAALEQFCHTVIDAVADQVPIVKPQAAFFEAYGGPGFAALWSVVAYARQRGLLVLMDAKRGDIGSTAEAYAEAFLGGGRDWHNPDRYADALTVNPYLGSDALEPFVRRCRDHGRGLFVLVKTSNPSSRELQDQPLLSEETIAQQVAKLVDYMGSGLVGARGYSSIGAVVGATYPEDMSDLRAWMPRAFFLVPGYGAQGGGAADTVHAFQSDGLGAVVSASRSVIYAYPGPDSSPQEVASAVAAAAQEMNSELRSALRQAGKAI